MQSHRNGTKVRWRAIAVPRQQTESTRLPAGKLATKLRPKILEYLKIRVLDVPDEDSEAEDVPPKVQRARLRQQLQAAKRKRQLGNDDDLVSVDACRTDSSSF